MVLALFHTNYGIGGWTIEVRNGFGAALFLKPIDSASQALEEALKL
jgi:hypothetical protein